MSNAQHTPVRLYLTYDQGVIAAYTKPITEAKAADRLFRLPRNPMTERFSQTLAAAPELLTALEDLVGEYAEFF